MEKEYIELLKKIRKEKDMDKLGNLFMNIISLVGLKMDEVAALNYFIAEQTIKADHNAKFIKEKLGLSVNNLSIEGIFKVQEALVNIYVDKYRKENNRGDI
ncbi:hypothetical protein [Enterococcus faecium]|uniref:hypothetical protein n=1 Tax=Enterococcus faecium TaxID=1352 RepID=UPI00035287FE|nr:hypothetical protein [Enterococcus faecium]EGP5129146.1 hypothetical protein [Enterococcus faecium]EME3512003.1 hypothetical protein [Enterococcus faecium]EME8119396.1 hypothetical protein [Enterococcus faecium]EME8193831.1 hypothetical protein [Enterococcus faecium]EPI26144.1 hypothetical protein D352_00118 [Enterococcus faecium LA4B-2]